MGYVVEFCGLPGSGKSRLARTVVARLRLRGVPTTDVMARLGPDATRPTRIARKLGAVGRGMIEPGSAALVAQIALRSGQDDLRDRIARPANLLVVRHAIRDAHRRPGVHVFDQGPRQEWWSAALRANRERVLGMAASDPAETADLLVRVDAPVELLADRLAARATRQSRLEAVDSSRLRAELESGNALFDVVCDQWARSPATDRPGFLRVDSLDPGAPDRILAAVVASYF